MSKKFDIKRTLGNPAPPLSIEAVEEMTQLIHNKKATDNAQRTMDNVAVQEAPIAQVKPESPVLNKKDESPVQRQPTPKVEKIIEAPEKGKRGRKPNPIIETERQLRVSVDLPESTFIQLKILVIQQKTDMKSYIRKLVEKDLAKK
jgi:hypothetical protein